jgi:predicted ArsR family transcriptional regulator
MPPFDRNAALAALADTTRRALLAELRRDGAPQDVRTLAAVVGLHPNSAREQLARLADAGLVRVATAAPAGRGRPGLRYQAVPESTSDPFRLLASALAGALTGIPEAAALTAAAGERWGREAAATLPGIEPDDALDAVLTLMDEAGFAPDPVGAGQAEVRLRDCPFLPIDPAHLEIVCGVHLGFLRGALRELHAPVDAASIHPFSEPDACSARLETRPDA